MTKLLSAKEAAQLTREAEQKQQINTALAIKPVLDSIYTQIQQTASDKIPRYWLEYDVRPYSLTQPQCQSVIAELRRQGYEAHAGPSDRPAVDEGCILIGWKPVSRPRILREG